MQMLEYIWNQLQDIHIHRQGDGVDMESLNQSFSMYQWKELSSGNTCRIISLEDFQFRFTIYLNSSGRIMTDESVHV